MPAKLLHWKKIFPYAGYFNRASWCDLKLFKDGREFIAVVTELDDNPGTSVTNSAETVAAEVRRLISITGKLVVIEHYPVSRGLRESWSFVHLDTEGTTWEHLTREKVEQLLGRKWEWD